MCKHAIELERKASKLCLDLKETKFIVRFATNGQKLKLIPHKMQTSII